MAKNILRQLKPEEYFYLHDGSAIKNIKEVPEVLEKISEDTFRYHVNPQTNDFAKWVRFLSDDQDFAAIVAKCIKKNDMINAVKDKLTSLEKVARAVKEAQGKAIGAIKPKAKKKPRPKRAKPARKKVVKKKAAKKLKAAEKKAVKRFKVAEKKAVKDLKAAEKKAAELKDTVLKKLKKITPKKAVGKAKVPCTSAYLTSGIREYLLGIITGLILGLIISTFI